MTNPRNQVSHHGIRPDTETYIIDGVTVTFTELEDNNSTAVGLAVTLSADNTVALCADGDFVLGKLLLVEGDGKCTVQIGGYVELPGGLAATLTRGLAIVGALGASSAKGYIRAVASGTAAELAKCRGFIEANGTPAAVVVRL